MTALAVLTKIAAVSMAAVVVLMTVFERLLMGIAVQMKAAATVNASDQYLVSSVELVRFS